MKTFDEHIHTLFVPRNSDIGKSQQGESLSFLFEILYLYICTVDNLSIISSFDTLVSGPHWEGWIVFGVRTCLFS